MSPILHANTSEHFIFLLCIMKLQPCKITLINITIIISNIITPKINETTAAAFTNLGFIFIAKCFSNVSKAKIISKNKKNFSV